MLYVHEALQNLEYNRFQLGLDIKALITSILKIKVQILSQELKNEAIMIPKEEVVNIGHNMLFVKFKAFVTYSVS